MDKKINKGLGIQKVFALRGHVGSNWKNNLENKPVGSSPHMIGNRGDKRLGDYNTYNLVWTNPDTGEVITEFEFIKPLSDKFSEDLNKLPEEDIKRLKIALNDLKLGYVFDDNDKRILNGGFDTLTHCLTSNSSVFTYCNGKFLAYSKSLSKANRLTYKIYKPEKSLTGYKCKIEISRCYAHRIDKITYDDKNITRSNNSLASLLEGKFGHDRDVAEFEKLFSDGFLRLIEK